MSSRILLVEDERNLATTLEDLLSAEGYQVAMVHDGPAGLAKAQSNSFDLIILDVMLPGKNGYSEFRVTI